ncbi:outer membrane beta-barrel protein [Panacibacter sp. DH6]|uniref:Outer membrane beta-barrel protein n=1 Tax=Panacibacter microcysteis TaxID=2793269 RepID=A0A931E3E2_9BACT|nr:OmpW family outer membrane protein [Panacibacter microcysteis]MBG9376338.1 outer membrane beta-barrel protein [Panacibacter microcysteis]
MKFFLTLAMLAISVVSYSQNNDKTGYIVKTSGDTLRGFLNAVELKLLNNTISFGASAGNLTTYTSAEIKSFGYDGGNSFEKVSYTNTVDASEVTRFAKMLSTGYYSLLTFWSKDIKYFIIKKPDNTYRLLMDDERLTTGFVNEKGNFQNELLFLSQACSELRPALERLNYSEKDLIGYVSKLNNCAAPSQANNIVLKKEQSQFNIFAYAGGITLGSKGHEYTARVLGKLSAPSIDKNLSLNFGINYMAQRKVSTEKVSINGYPAFKTQTAERSVLSVPLTVQYYLTKGFIKPYIDAGLSIDYLQRNGELDGAGKIINENKAGLAFTAAFGIDCYITNRLFIRADYRYELFMHYPTIGIAYIFK